MTMGESGEPVEGEVSARSDALASFDRAAFGIDAGRKYGFDMKVTLRIQVEAVAKE